ncbi:flagellar basal-body MS-ring/collar protein FliF [Aerolutibacter ruishenii]|uniref:flagellar basal-body MS-ring/collar protein FliF n=1 Tax=Aerolutibacter ruishenii TaxID=686800 RepID=UPI0030CBAC48
MSVYGTLVGPLLRTASIPFKIDSTSGALAVPQEQLGQAKLALAAAGLPASQDKGFEMMQGDQGFGTSQFVENARYQHALETELARTIGQLRPVREARVHLALPKPSAFTRQKQPASASVVLQMQAGSALEAGQVDAILHLVASSIPDLAPDRVTVVDQFGRMLSNPDPDSEAARGAKQFDQQRRQEAVYVQRIQALLEPMTGPGRVSAQVSVDMDFSQTEEAREIYGQDPARVRSEQISENGRLAAAPTAAAQGVPGSASNTPDPAGTTPVSVPAATAATPAADGGATSRTAVRNYELDRTLTHTRQATGRIRRVTAAVLVDNLPGAASSGKPTTRALNAGELARIQTLVQQAIGFDAARGDAVSVVNAPFAGAPQAEPQAAPLWEKPGARDLLRTVLGGLAVLLVIWVVLRPAFRQLLAPKPHYTVATVVDEPMPLQAPEPTRTRDPEAARKAASFEEKLDVARTAVNTDPKRVAQVVRDLVESDG